jgi:hypothetical protein
MAKIEHDRDRWGVARAADSERSRLVRVGDLVEALARVDEDERSTSDAAGIVWDRLADAALFELRKDGEAQPVGQSWRSLADWARPMLARVMEADPGPDDPRWLKGPAGARDLGRLAWCHAGRVDLNYGAAARLAVLHAVAVAAFPELEWPAESRPAEASSSLDDAGVRRPVGQPAPGLPGNDELAREHAAEKRQKPHGATKRLAQKYGVDEATIQRRVNKAKAAAPAAAWRALATGGKR